jgi:hypothetical protein
MDLGIRQETLTNIKGLPVLLQLPVVPCYALTTHKTQALSIQHRVNGCFEGIFAQGRVVIRRGSQLMSFSLEGVVA